MDKPLFINVYLSLIQIASIPCLPVAINVAGMMQSSYMKLFRVNIEQRQVIYVLLALMTKGNEMTFPHSLIRTAPQLKQIKRWWKSAANDAHYCSVFRLTEFGLGD